jgi:anti-sigma B factor antagonist
VELTITTQTDLHRRGVVTAVGAIDLATRDLLLTAGQAVLKESVNRGLVLHLAGVTFIDSSGIGAIVELAGDATDAERDFALAEPSDRVVRILQVTGLFDQWPIEFASS